MKRIRFHVRLWWHESKEKLRWKIAYLLPRSIALLAFVRVYSVLGECPGGENGDYARAYRAFEGGTGR